MMMSLAHGKVTESAARLVLAERLLKVGVSWLVGVQMASLDHSSFRASVSMPKTIHPLIARLLIW